jgi:hypothetical protein
VACGPARGGQAHHRIDPRLHPGHPSQARNPWPPDQSRNDIQVITLLGSQATGLASVEYDPTIVSLASQDSRTTCLPEQGNSPTQLVNRYLDSVADHKIRHRPSSTLPFHPHCLLSWRPDERQINPEILADAVRQNAVGI